MTKMQTGPLLKAVAKEKFAAGADIRKIRENKEAMQSATNDA